MDNGESFAIVKLGRQKLYVLNWDFQHKVHRNTIINQLITLDIHAGATVLPPMPGDEWAETYSCTFNESKSALCVEESCDQSTSLAIQCLTHEEIVNQESKLSYIKKCIFTVVLVRLQHFVLEISTD